MTPQEAATAIDARAGALIECLTLSRRIVWTCNRSPNGLGDCLESPWVWHITLVFRGQTPNLEMAAGELGQAIEQTLDALQVVVEKEGKP